MSDRLHVLLVEDSADDARLLERAFRQAGHDPVITRVETAETLRSALADDWDVVLADHRLPGFGAMEALEIIREAGVDLPFIVVTGTVGEERAAALLRAGAHDFVLKDRLTRLVPAVEREVREARNREDRRRARVELERARIRFQALIEGASDAVLVLNEEGEIIYCSPSAEDILGRSPAEIEGKGALEFVDPRDRGWVGERLADVVRRNGQGRAEFRVIHVDGEVRHVESVATNLLDQEGVAGIVVNTRDLSERKALESQLLQAQKMEAVGRLAGGVAHDFNNLLTVITGNAELLRSGAEQGSVEVEAIEEVLGAADRASGLTRQLLTFSRQRASDPRVVDLGQVVAGLENMLRRLMGEDIRLAVRTCGAPTLVKADPVHLEQIVMNFAVNARDVMPQGGDVRVSVDRHEDGSPGAQRSWVRLRFSDSGPGVPEEIRDQIFEPYFSTKELGTGLGLSTVYGIVSQSRGRIRLETEEGEGTTFVVDLPEVTERPVEPEQAEPATAGAARAAAGRVLLVEDDAAVRGVVSRILESQGHTVLAAETAEAALEIASAESGFDLLVTDLIMPGMRGSDLAARLREQEPRLPILFISGYSGDSFPGTAATATEAAFLEKPFTPRELAAKVTAVLEGAGA